MLEAPDDPSHHMMMVMVMVVHVVMMMVVVVLSELFASGPGFRRGRPIFHRCEGFDGIGDRFKQFGKGLSGPQSSIIARGRARRTSRRNG
jgi:hypothetical protein